MTRLSLAAALLFLAAAPTASAATERLSVGAGGSQAAGASANPTISADGRLVAFESSSAGLIAGDTNGRRDLFIRDRVAGRTERVSLGAAGQANGDSSFPVISGSGRFVAFESLATNLAARDTNGVQDVFLRDRFTGFTQRVSVRGAGVQANGRSGLPAVSADGRYVAFVSAASNLVAGDMNGVPDVFVRDRATGVTVRAGLGPVAAPVGARVAAVSLSADARLLAFSSAARLVPGDTNGAPDVFVRDSLTGATQRVSVGAGGAQAAGVSAQPDISADGRLVGFASSAANLVSGDANDQIDVFVRDLAAGTTERVSRSSTGGEGEGPSGIPSLSSDGRYVVFESTAPDLTVGDTNELADVFVRDRLLGSTERLSVGGTAVQADNVSANGTLSADGRFVAFDSLATNLVRGDTNVLRDVFVRERPPPVLGRAVNVQEVKGSVLVSIPSSSARAAATVPGIKGRRFVALREVRSIPVGSLLDTRRGTVRLTSARDTAGTTQSGDFSAGVFQVLQSRRRRARGLTELRLKGSSFRGCRRAHARGAGVVAARHRLSRLVRRRLRGNARGRFRTRGRYSAATVRGTVWTVTDRCDGTLTRVSRGRVAVRDFRRRRTVTVRRGKRYLARAPR